MFCKIPKLKQSKRLINEIYVHCSATPPKMNIGAKWIRKLHKGKGWSDIGYHYVIKRDGKLELGRDVDRIGAHVRGYNSNSIGVCLIGGVDDYNEAEDNYTDSQWRTLNWLLTMLKQMYNAEILGHNQRANKACPCFDVPDELANGRLKGV